MSILRRWLLRLFSLFRHTSADADLAREIESHLRLLQDTFVAQGMTAEEARYAARRAFGGVEQAKEHHRDARSFSSVAGWSMDLRLGVRMLLKYPGLTLVGGLSMAFAIAIGAAGFEALTQILSPALPLDEGERIVVIRSWDASANREELHTARDFAVWRGELLAIQDIGAFRTVERTLTAGDEGGEPVQVAEISASAFRLARVAPLLGRTLDETDERAGAPPVVVIGYDLWQERFHGDRNVPGRTVRLGKAEASIVGVMPDGFAFPVSHSVWVPLPLDVSGYGPLEGPELRVFGRLAPGVSIQQAQAAVSVAGARRAAVLPATHAHLRPEVLPYAQAIFDLTEVAVGATAINVFLVMFLVLVCANVAALIFARAVTRQNEILVRNALGASRGRIVMQLFAEALVLGGVAAILGLTAAGFALRWWMSVSAAEAGGRLPFWLNDSLSPRTIFYAAGLGILGAAIAGIVPALKVTGRRLEGRLREAASGSTDARFGGIWTMMIVTQVAMTVAFPATAFFAREYVTGIQSLDPGVDAGRYLTARLEMDQDPAANAASTVLELERRLETDPAIAGVTFSTRLPRTSHPERRVEVEGDVFGASEQRVTSASVALDYFAVLEAPPLAGRHFTSADLAADARTVIVNSSFARRLLAGRNSIGRRIRYAAVAGGAAGPWYEIIGVVKDLGMIHDDARNAAGVYHPMNAGAPVAMAIHVRGDAAALAPRVRAIAAAVDPSLRLYEVLPLDKIGSTLWRELDFLFRLLMLISAVALLLSLAGIYSVMSLTVSRRTREIGIRVALGADRRRIVAVVSSRAVAQVGVGIIAGGGLVLALTEAINGITAARSAVVLAYMAAMLAVCMLATIVPTRRALRVEPTEALRAE